MTIKKRKKAWIIVQGMSGAIGSQVLGISLSLAIKTMTNWAVQLRNWRQLPDCAFSHKMPNCAHSGQLANPPRESMTQLIGSIRRQFCGIRAPACQTPFAQLLHVLTQWKARGGLKWASEKRRQKARRRRATSEEKARNSGTAAEGANGRREAYVQRTPRAPAGLQERTKTNEEAGSKVARG